MDNYTKKTKLTTRIQTQTKQTVSGFEQNNGLTKKKNSSQLQLTLPHEKKGIVGLFNNISMKSKMGPNQQLSPKQPNVSHRFLQN